MREKHFLGFWAKLLVTDLSWTVTIVLVTDIFGLQGLEAYLHETCFSGRTAQFVNNYN
jgi:hypothetical protein